MKLFEQGRASGKSFVLTLILGEMLTRRGELGPLARLWTVAPAAKKRPAESKAGSNDKRPENR